MAVSSSAPPLPCGLPVRQVAGSYRASPLRLQRGCTVRPVAPPSSHGSTVRSFPESPLEGLAWVSHHVTAWLGPRSHMRREPGLGTGSRPGGLSPGPPVGLGRVARHPQQQLPSPPWLPGPLRERQRVRKFCFLNKTQDYRCFCLRIISGSQALLASLNFRV